MSNKQSSVDWLISQLQKSKDFHRVLNEVSQMSTAKVDIIEQAKAMHKEEIKEAREDGHTSTYTEYDSDTKLYLEGRHEQYYNETFGGNNED